MKKGSRSKKNMLTKNIFNYKYFILIFCILLFIVIGVLLSKNFTGNAIGDINLGDAEDPLDIGINPANIPQTQEDAKTVAANYLKKEWGKILADNKYVGPTIKEYNEKIGPYLNPILKIILGVEPSISWLFFLTLAIWILFVTYFFRILSGFSTFSKGASFAISICMVVIMSIFGWSRMSATWIINTISVLTSWWMQLIVAVAVIIALMLASIFSKEFENLIKQIKENRKKMQQAQDIDLLKLKQKGTDKIQKTLTE